MGKTIKSYPLGTSLLHYHIPCVVTCCFQIVESTLTSIAKQSINIHDSHKMKPGKRRWNPPRRPDDRGNTANKRPKAADRRPKQNQAGQSRANHAASDSHVSDRDARQNIRQNTDTTHPAHPNFNVRASNIDIQVGTSQRQPAVSTDQFPSHAPQQSGQQRCEESTPSHSAVSI